jgi:hypothetical protein
VNWSPHEYFLNAARVSLKRVTGRILKISKSFQAKALSSIFSIRRQQKNLKIIGAYTESSDLIVKTLKKIFIS